ncbi:hypothetical protein BN946_scf185008.g95 [Trametes cinnabarina]|uniref:F-box domain-containing protein n=1 Tax=Pycnoporus cinnabarinus TaxID=5643 RepID=A0A060SFS4_PYCCI|nr:hypothetical protein BN946_scf185008.g95 [Trametes cinnabarina]
MASMLKRSSECREDAVVHARKVLEDKISNYADVIIDLKTQLNRLSPIARLPPEILSEVFALISMHYYEQSWRYQHGPLHVYKWLAVAHVCRAWRSIALDTPRLWSNIIITRPEVDEVVLARSKKAPLRLSAHIYHQDDPRATILQTIMEDAARLKEVQLTGPARALQVLTSRWTNRADLLEGLSLNSSFRLFEHTTFHSSPPLSSNIFSHHFPKLRHLTICRLNVSWANPLFCSTLVTLTVDARHEMSDTTGEFSHLLNVLDHMRFLEVLSLTDAIPRLPEGVATLPEVERLVSLPRLKMLEVHSQAIDCARFLRHLSLPPNVKFKIVARTERGSVDFVQALRDHLDHTDHLHTVRLERRSISQLHLRGWRSTIKSRESVFEVLAEADVDVYLDTNAFGRPLDTLISNSAFLSHVQRLMIEPTSRNWFWRELFAEASELRELSLIAEADDGFLPALSAVLNTTPSDDERTGTISLPHLHTLELYGARFGCPHSDHISQWLEDLMEWLIARCHADAPILQLVVRMCLNADTEDIDRLREIVPYVQWDGHVSFERFSGVLDSDEEAEMDDDYDDELDYLPVDPDYGYDDADLELWMTPFGW